MNTTANPSTAVVTGPDTNTSPAGVTATAGGIGNEQHGGAANAPVTVPPAFVALARKLSRLDRLEYIDNSSIIYQLVDDATAALKRARIPPHESTGAAQKRWEDMTAEEKDVSNREKIDAMPPGFRGLYRIVWFCRENQMCSTALRLRAYLCSLYNGSNARKVDLSDVQTFDGRIRRDFTEILAHLGSSASGLWDHEIHTAFEKCGLKSYFDAGFPRRRG